MNSIKNSSDEWRPRRKEENTYELELDRECDLELELRERGQDSFLFFLSFFGHASSVLSFLFLSSKKKENSNIQLKY